MKKRWEFYTAEEDKVNEIANKFSISKLLSQILINRGITEDEKIEVFLNPTRNDFYDPFLMPDMEKTVSRVIKAIETNEKVIIYGDYDVDGITSITVLKKFLEERGLTVDYYIPNRLEEGYGLNKEAVQKIIDEKYTLVITVDCGISSTEEIELCNKEKIDVIITDHHEPLEVLPNAYAVVDCKRKDNNYPFRELCRGRSSI